jgi:lipoprotein-anchoring transpeptidase ErfK/SrfK
MVAPTPVVTLGRSVVVHAAPSAASGVVGTLTARTPLTQSPTTLPVVATKDGWLRVQLPTRPNGATGWVPKSAGSIGSTDWKIVVHRDERRADVLAGGVVQATFPIVVGRPSTPTPLGRFFVVEKLRLAPGVAEGPWALATSAHSDVLREFGGGDGRVALHGTIGLPGALGTFASHGCVRFAPAAITWIAQRVGLGTPIVVTR